MVKRLDTLFDKYEFEDQEFPQAIQLNQLQECFIRNALAETAEEKLNLIPDPTLSESASNNKFVKENEYLRGMIAAYSYLLNSSQDSKENAMLDSKNKETV